MIEKKRKGKAFTIIHYRQVKPLMENGNPCSETFRPFGLKRVPRGGVRKVKIIYSWGARMEQKPFVIIKSSNTPILILQIKTLWLNMS